MGDRAGLGVGRRRAQRAAVVLAVVLGTGLVPAMAPAGAAPGDPIQDLGRPSVTSVTFSSPTVDASAGDVTVSAFVAVEDALSGVATADIVLQGPWGDFLRGQAFDVVSGTRQDGVMRLDILVAQHTPPGPHCLGNVFVEDRVGHSDTVFSGELPGTCVDVISPGDTNAPVISDITVSPATVDSAAGDATIVVEATISDDLSGVQYVLADLRPGTQAPGGPREITGTAGAPISGTRTDGVWRVEAVLPRYSQVGEWCVERLSAVDGRPRVGAGSGPCFTVTAGAVDSTAPVATGVTLSTTTVDASAADVPVKAFVSVTDAGSGVRTAQLDFALAGGPIAFGGSTFEMAQGTRNDGVMEVQMAVSRYTPPGTYCLNGLLLEDRTDHSRTYGPGELPGAPCLEVTSPGDLEAPEIGAITVLTPVVDATAGDATAVIEVALTDDLAGVEAAMVEVARPGGGPAEGSRQDIDALADAPVSGTRTDGVWRFEAQLPQYSRTGTWCVELVSAIDGAGHRVDDRSPAEACFVNDRLPVIGDLSLTTREGSSVAAPITASDPRGGPLTYTVGTPAHGTVTGTAPALTYTPDPGFVGTDSFDVTVTDSRGRSATGTVTIEVVAKIGTVLIAEPAIAQILPLRIGLAFEARLTEVGGAPLPNRPVTFRAGAATCTTLTDANGRARCALTVSSLLPTLLGLGYQATFPGDADHRGATASGPAIRIRLLL